ncbi:hypothetical protein RCH11_002005 [Glaciihabitans sp. GrIS 2.15]|nr:hypothetical protein [Glaciihabitans sp. GrIS 2.15]
MAKSAGELMAELEEKYRRDPVYRATVDVAARTSAANAAEKKRKLAAFNEDLLAAGITETSDRMTGKRSTDVRIVEIAFKHLAMEGYDEFTREWIASYLTTRAAEPYWDRILEMLRTAPSGSGEATQLAHTLAVCARAKNVDELMALALDPSLGQSRVLFLRPINRLGRAHGNAFVAQFVGDADLGWEAGRIMRGIGPSAP